MFAAFKQFFAMFANLFAAGNNLAIAAEVVSRVAVEASQEMLAESQLLRAQRIAKLEKESGVKLASVVPAIPVVKAG
jgi:hypothetical protein